MEQHLLNGAERREAAVQTINAHIALTSNVCSATYVPTRDGPTSRGRVPLCVSCHPDSVQS